MIQLLSKLISKIKKEEFRLDESLSVSYLLRFILGKIFAYMRFVVTFKKLKLGFVGKRSTILATNLIYSSRNLSIADDCHIDALSKEGISFGDNVSIQKRVVIECSGSLKNLGKGLKVGNNVGIGSNSFLGCAGGIDIGDDTIIGNFVSFHSENHNFEDPNTLIRSQGVSRKGIVIGKNCWIGAKATILDGTVIGNNCIVAAGAVLTGKNYGNDVIIAGVPAKVIKEIANEYP
jgi:acetyltransferase-like isoleucine patch superfamily enzyme